MANVNALKKKKVENPEPPTPGMPSGNLEQTPRNQESKETLLFKVPGSKYEEFCQDAGKECGFKKGAKTAFFLKIFDHYQRTKDL